MPTLPLRYACDRSHALAPSRSPRTRASGAPPAPRTLEPTSSGVPWPSRWYRFGEIDTKPWWANRRVHSRYHSSQPGAWWMTTMPGNGPAPRGRATYAWIGSPLWPFIVTVSAIMPSYWLVWYACAMALPPCEVLDEIRESYHRRVGPDRDLTVTAFGRIPGAIPRGGVPS